VSFVLWWWTSRALPNIRVPWRRLVPGAVLGAIGLEVLKVAGAFYVPRAVASSSQLYGSLGVVFAILAWLLFFGRLIVYSATVNVVRWEEDHGTVVIDIRVPNLPGEQNDPDATRAGQQDPEGDVVKT
jgi:membrane protein